MVNEALKRACDACGGQTQLAEAATKKRNDPAHVLTQAMVWYWLERSKKGMAAEWVIPIEQASGVPRHELRADIYPAPIEETAA